MDTKVMFLKQLALKVTSATSIKDVTGETVCEVLDYIVKNYNVTGGEPGKDGKSVTAISLTTDETGKVTGGTVSYSDETTSEITVTVSEAGV